MVTDLYLLTPSCLFSSHRCTCYDQFDGSRCQQTRHSFHGNGWAWYAPLSQCEDSHTSIEFVTQQDNGLIFYNGPTHELASGEDTDFILLELRSGYPVLRLNHGSGEVKLEIDRHDKRGIRQLQKLNDGVWHRVDIFRRGKVSLVVIFSYLYHKILLIKTMDTCLNMLKQSPKLCSTPVP